MEVNQRRKEQRLLPFLMAYRSSSHFTVYVKSETTKDNKD
jgi:hypothetical protein